MDAQQFLAEFGHIANAPNGIAQVRKMIYQLAITGMLTARSERAEDARALLANIEVARQELIRKKKYKRMPKLESEPLRAPSGVVLPLNWCWTRLLDVGEISPRNEADDDEWAAFVPMSGIPQMHRGSVVSDTIKWRDIKKGYTHVANGDVVLAKITPCFENGKAAVISDLKIASGLGAGTTELHVFRPFHEGILSAYVYLFLRSPYFVIDGEKNMTGTAGQKRLPTDYFATRAFPFYVTLPAMAEGKRTLVRQGDLPLTITGENVGKCARVPALDFKAYVSQHVSLIRLRDSSLAEFIHFWMINSYGGRNFLARYIYGDKPGLNLAQVGSVLIPVPPESVRSEILERLRQYQILCDRLAIKTDSERQMATMLATAATLAFVK